MSDDGGHDYGSDPEQAHWCRNCGLSRAFVEEHRYSCRQRRAAGEAFVRNDPDYLAWANFRAHHHAPGWSDFPLSTLVEQGVLQRINQRFLWPLGLALTVTVPTSVNKEHDWGSAYLCVVETNPPQAVVSAGVEREKDYAKWVTDRLALLGTREAGTSKSKEG